MLAALVASLRRELADSQAALAEAAAELARARERIAELEARLGQTPRNSSKPPSSEGLGKPPPMPRSLRKKSGRRPGGQAGHEGRTLAQVARPDREVPHEPACCGRCGAGLAGTAPEGAEAPAQYGPRIAAIIIYPYFGQFLPGKRTTQALAGLFGIPLSPGRSRASHPGLPGAWMASWSGPGRRSPPVRWPGSMRRGSAWRAGCTGCTVPAPASTPC